MPMGYGAAAAVTVETEDLKKMNLSTFRQFLHELEQSQTSLDTFAQLLKQESEPEYLDDAVCAYRKFTRTFRQMFGVTIGLDYHDPSEEGSTYDQVDGAFFTLSFDDVYTLTEDAERLKNQLPFKLSLYTQFG